MRVGEAVTKVRVVILEVGVMHLEPYAGDMDGVDMRREAPMRVVDVAADVAHAVDDVLAVGHRLFEIGPAEGALIDLFEQSRLFVVNASRTELAGYHVIDGIVIDA